MPNTADELDEIIDAVVAGPKSASVDGRSATSQDVSDLLEVKNDRAAQASATTSKFGMRIVQLVPPGCG